MMIIKRIEYVSSSKYDPISTDFWACGNHDLSFRVDSLKSPFVKGDFQPLPKSPHTPLCQRGAREKMRYDFPFQPIELHGVCPEVHLING